MRFICQHQKTEEWAPYQKKRNMVIIFGIMWYTSGYLKPGVRSEGFANGRAGQVWYGSRKTGMVEGRKIEEEI